MEEPLEEQVPTSEPSGLHPTPRYALITPVRDEESFIGDMIESVAQQSIPPSRWIIVDDGSCDRTADIIRSYAYRLPYLELLQLSPREPRRPGGEEAVPQAMQKLDLGGFEFIARFDADIVLSGDYMARLLRKFASDPRLGIAGGTLYVQHNGKARIEDHSDRHVRGALKMYRTGCLRDIGGLTTRIGWDTLDEVSAWAHGWETRSFREIVALHRRPTGNGIAAHQIYRHRGRAEYLTWSDPLFVLGKAIKLAAVECSPLHAVFYFWGFVASYIGRDNRIQNRTIIRVRRDEQRSRMRRMLGLGS